MKSLKQLLAKKFHVMIHSEVQVDWYVGRCEKSSREYPVGRRAGELQAHARLLSFHATQLLFSDSHLVVYSLLRRRCHSEFEPAD